MALKKLNSTKLNQKFDFLNRSREIDLIKTLVDCILNHYSNKEKCKSWLRHFIFLGPCLQLALPPPFHLSTTTSREGRFWDVAWGVGVEGVWGGGLRGIAGHSGGLARLPSQNMGIWHSVPDQEVTRDLHGSRPLKSRARHSLFLKSTQLQGTFLNSRGDRGLLVTNERAFSYPLALTQKGEALNSLFVCFSMFGRFPN